MCWRPRAQKHWPQAAAPATAGIQTAALHVPLAVPRVAGHYQSVSAIPAQSNAALQQAINLENVPQSWRPACNSSSCRIHGKVGASSPVHLRSRPVSAHGGELSLQPQRGAFVQGNAVEEAQGGIRYIRNATAPPTMPSRSGSSTAGIRARAGYDVR